jgi:hypothetical protein
LGIESHLKIERFHKNFEAKYVDELAILQKTEDHLGGV